MNIMKDKRGDLPSLFFAIVSVFIAGIVLFVLSHLFFNVYGEIGNILENTGDGRYNDSQAHQFIETAQNIERSIWDYVFLAIAIGYVMMLGVLAFSTRISPIFYWIYALASLFGLAMGVIFANFWDLLSQRADMADTIARFPITDAIMGTFFPIYISVIIVLTIILLFGKASSSQGGLG